jgi:hypothetical protein|tara:strand:- start:388 stop:1041 length:654 start_codon:yes stop_codon:yes gene_type:complete
MQTPLVRFTEVEAVNRILSTVGGEKISAMTNLSFTADAAYTALRDAMRDLMSAPYGFNTESDVVLTPNGSNEIDLSTSGYTGTYISKIDFESEDAGNFDVVIKGTKLYDRNTLSYTAFTGESYKATVSYYLQFEDLPEAVKSFVTAMAAKDFQAQMVGNPQMDAILTQKFLATRAEFYAFESQQFDYTMFDNFDTFKIISTSGRPGFGGVHWFTSRG